jgi:hypothetical protein
MNKIWLACIFLTAFIMVAIVKTHEVNSLQPFFRGERTLKLKRFAEAKKTLSVSDQELLELWESMLTGRSAPLSKWMKTQYRTLGLNHLFTPSGFHLTAVLTPFLRFFSSTKSHLCLLLCIALGLCFIPGQGALKRMVMIKSQQKIFTLRLGFFIGLTIDILFGSFTDSPLSFAYSFLFLGIVYSGSKGLGLIWWFFLGQMMIAYFQNLQMSPMVLLFSPILNFCFGLSMPILFVLAFPLWHWQLFLGLKVLTALQWMVNLSGNFLFLLPSMEIHFGFLLLLIFIIIGRGRYALMACLLLSNSLNLDLNRNPTMGSQEFVPQGAVVRIMYGEKEDVVFFEDGKCKRQLVRGFWWEKCSSSRRRKSSNQLITKLSYP